MQQSLRHSRRLPQTMTVNELIEELMTLAKRGYGDDPVYSTSDYGDISHTEQLNGVEVVDEVEIEESAYSRSGYAVGNEEEHTPGAPTVIVLRYQN